MRVTLADAKAICIFFFCKNISVYATYNGYSFNYTVTFEQDEEMRKNINISG